MTPDILETVPIHVENPIVQIVDRDVSMAATAQVGARLYSIRIEAVEPVATPEVANDAAGQLLRLKSPPSSLPHPDKVSDSDEENKATVNEVEGGTREPIGPCRNPVTDAKYTKQVGKFSFHVAKRHSDTRCEQWAAPHAKRSRVDNVEQAHSPIHKKEDSSDDLSEASQSVDNNVENEEEELLI